MGVSSNVIGHRGNPQDKRHQDEGQLVRPSMAHCHFLDLFVPGRGTCTGVSARSSSHPPLHHQRRVLSKQAHARLHSISLPSLVNSQSRPRIQTQVRKSFSPIYSKTINSVNPGRKTSASQVSMSLFHTPSCNSRHKVRRIHQPSSLLPLIHTSQ